MPANKQTIAGMARSYHSNQDNFAGLPPAGLILMLGLNTNGLSCDEIQLPIRPKHHPLSNKLLRKRQTIQCGERGGATWADQRQVVGEQPH
jgi:hypothetical protein